MVQLCLLDVLFTLLIFLERKTYGNSIPCAWLETGGILESGKILKHKFYLVQSRQTCRARQKCSYKLESIFDHKSLSFKLVGLDDMRSYWFQMHFCNRVYHRFHHYCRRTPNEIAYKLIQRGTWLLLKEVYCICPNLADVKHFEYYRGVHPYEKRFNGYVLSMTCETLVPCETFNSPCYSEVARGDGKIYEGRLTCECHPGYFCPIYFIGRNRELIDSYNHLYILRCKKRFY